MWRSRALYLLLLLASLALIRVYSDRSVGFMLLYALLLLLLFSLAAVLLAPVVFSIDEKVDRQVLIKGEDARYTSRLTNRGLFFYPSIRCTYHNEETVGYTAPFTGGLPPRGRVEAEGTLAFPYRGIYQLGIRSIAVTDFLGLFRITFTVHSPLTVTVYPVGDESFSLYIRGETMQTSFRQDRFDESFADVADVRKYAPSDSLRRVHWKLSAKRGELMVKNYQTFDPNQTILFVDTTAPPLSGMERTAFEDKLVSYAAAAVNYCSQGRLPAYLVYGAESEDVAVIDPAGKIETVYRILAGLRFEDEAPAFPAYAETLDQGAVCYNLLLFFTRVDGAVFSALKQFAAFDHNLFVFLFLPAADGLPEDTRRTVKSLRACGVTVNVVEV